MRDQNGRWIVAMCQVAGVAVLLGLIGIDAAGEQPADEGVQNSFEAESFELAPGIVVDADRPLIYLIAPGGGIKAVDSRTGEQRWRNDSATVPLVVVAGRLIAQAAPDHPSAGMLDLIFLDVHNDGRCALRIEAPIPPDVLPLVDQRLGASFSLHARTRGEVVLITWHYLEKDVTGVAPPPGAPPYRRNESGSFLIDVKTGRVTPTKTGTEAEPQSWPESVRRLLNAGELREPPWRVGAILATTVLRADDEGGGEVVLRRWQADSGEALPDVVLFGETAVARAPSADRKHIMISSTLPVLGADGERFLWSIFSTESGKQLGAFQRQTSAPLYCVLDGLLLHQSLPFGRRIDGEWVEEPSKLRAFDLDTGGECWSLPVRDTAFRGPRPPG